MKSQMRPQANSKEVRRDDEYGLPVAEETERSILGAILLNNDCFFSVCEIVEPQDFSLDSHRRIYVAISEVMNAGAGADIVTIADNLLKKRSVEAVGGVAYISALPDNSLGSPERTARMAREIKELSQRRQLFKRLVNSQKQLLDRTVSLDSCVGQIEGDLLATTAATSRGKAQKIEEYSREVFTELMRLRQERRSVVGLKTGVPDLDRATTGLRDGEVIVIAARPGVGKSALALGIAVENSSHDVPVGYFSVEMRKDELLLRAVSNVANINHTLLRDPKELDEEEVNKIADVLSMMNKWPLWIDDAVLDVTEMIARARMLVSRGVKLIIVDYVQRVRVRSEQDPRLKINMVSAAFAEFAKSLKVPVILVSQLKRLENPNARPALHNLKESGNLEEDAHVVILLYRPMTRDGSFTHEDELIIAKQRSGPIGPVPSYFRDKSLTWEERVIEAREKKDDKQIPLKGGDDEHSA